MHAFSASGQENIVNRWFVAALITLALIVLVSPGIVGRLAEKSVEENLNFAASDSDEIVVTTESFVRGWFTSEGRHRIALRDGPVRALFEDETGGEAPSLVIETHVDHGLVPVTSVSRESGSLMPGLASTVSTMKIDAGNGEIFELPGKIYSEVGLTGEITSRFLMGAGAKAIDDTALEWQGADVTVRANPSSGSISYEGKVLPFSFLDERGGPRFGTMTIEGEQTRSRFGFNVGTAKIELDSLTVETSDGPGATFGRFAVDARNELDGDRVNATTKLLVSGIPAPALGDIDIVVDVVLNGLDAISLHEIVDSLQNTQSSGDPQEALANLYPLIEADLQRLLSSGLEVRFDKLNIALPDGELTTNLRLELPASDSADDFSWPALLLALDASADVRMPVKLFDIVEVLNPDLTMLVAMGVLKKEDDYYEMHAEYAKGLVTVNGAPMPIPLPGM